MNEAAKKALEKYSAATRAIKAHLDENSGIFSAHQRLLMQQLDSENELRDAVAISGFGISNRDFVVTITPQSQTFVDPEYVKELIAQGKISKELEGSLIQTQQRSPRISIRENTI